MRNVTENVTDLLRAVLTSGEMWGALIGLIGIVLFILRPDFPRELWVAIVMFLSTVLGSLGIVVASTKLQRIRAAREGRKA